MVESYVIINALPTTAVEAKAIFPVTLVKNKPVGIKVNCPPLVDKGTGAVIVLIVVVPLTKVIFAMGAMVAEEAIVGAGPTVAVGLD